MHYGLGRHDRDMSRDQDIKARMVSFYRSCLRKTRALNEFLVLCFICDPLHYLYGLHQNQHWLYDAPNRGGAAIYIQHQIQHDSGDVVVCCRTIVRDLSMQTRAVPVEYDH